MPWKPILSLLIHQGLQVSEMAALRVGDVRLEEGVLRVGATARTNAQNLPLESTQILLLDRYIRQERPRLLKGDTDRLILTKLGTAEQGEGIHYLVSTLQGLFPGRPLTSTTIRQSVITQWLKEGKDLRMVQLLAGHKYPSATERYQQNQVEELKAALLRHHPLR